MMNRAHTVHTYFYSYANFLHKEDHVYNTSFFPSPASDGLFGSSCVPSPES